jgi:hypothetical protein
VNVGRTLFSQVMDFVPWTSFDRIVTRYGGDVRVRSLRCGEQFRIMAFAQMTYRESLRDIEACGFKVSRRRHYRAAAVGKRPRVARRFCPRAALGHRFGSARSCVPAGGGFPGVRDIFPRNPSRPRQGRRWMASGPGSHFGWSRPGTRALPRPPKGAPATERIGDVADRDAGGRDLDPGR